MFKLIFKKYEKQLESLELDIKVPRTAGRQTKRSNVPHQTAEEYFRRSIFIPLLDNIISDLQSCFPEKTLDTFQLTALLPQNILKPSEKNIKNVLQL